MFLLGALVGPVTADPPPADPRDRPALSPYGDTYTPEELAALDRVLHAGNLTREDLAFRKDMAKGIACLPVVKAMLQDPLLIAPVMDQVSALTKPEASDTADAASQCIAAAAALLTWDGGRPWELRVLRRGPDAAAPPPTTLPQNPAEALERLREHVGMEGLAFLETSEADLQFLGRRLPNEMLMREVFASPYGPELTERIEARAKASAPSLVYDLAARIEVRHLVDYWMRACGALLAQVPRWPASAFPADRPLIAETLVGRIAIGTPKDDVYTGDFAAIVDPGGNDRYEHGRFGAAYGPQNQRVGVLIDLGGDDLYDAGDVDVTLGAACFGVAALVDRGQGNDRYVGGHLSLGAAVAGVGVLYDDGGSDTYEGKTFTQGAAGFGIGLLYDRAVGAAPAVKTDEETKDPIEIAKWDNDRLHAWCCAQAFARTQGVALCINTRGNEVYEAGGVYLDAPLFADRYQSFSQGFAIGAREIDYAGGFALLIDRAGNDRYLGDIYDQGVGYWYSAGLLWDGGGNDLYEMTQYGQGSGIHLAVGGLVDVSGSDAYVMHSGLGQGGSHDWAGGILHDRGGNDRYHGNTSCNGCGLTNSVGIFLDRAGDDTYATRKDGGFNAGRPARGFGSVGLFVDLGGKDDYLGGRTDGQQWRDSDVGLGLDLEPVGATTGGSGGTSTPNQLSGRAEIPVIVKYEGPLTQPVFDELWAIAIRWEVGDNRVIVPEARKRLIAFGPEVVPYLDKKMDDNDTGLALRAYVDVLKGLSADGGAARVLELLRRNAASDSAQRRKTALHLIGELKVKEAEDTVVALLDSDDVELWRRAPGVLLALGSHAGDARLREWLGQSDERRLLVALGTLLGLDSDVYPLVRPLFAHPLVTVRTRLATLLAERQATYGKSVLADLGAEDLSERARRTLLDTVARGPLPPDAPAVARVAALLTHADWGMRADAARLARAWLAAKDADAALLKPLADALAALLTTETDPYVRGQAGATK